MKKNPLVSLCDTQFRVPDTQGFWKKYYPKRSEGVEIFSKTCHDLAGQGHRITFAQ